MAKKNTANDKNFEETAKKSERMHKRITQVVCLILAALMVLGGTAGILITTLVG